jgi:5-methylcytosine-specific restriction protein B
MQTHPLNLISYGPPGTGKTYHAITRAVAICTNRSVEFVKKREGGRKDIEIQFSQLCEEGRIEMITFHQSYDYTDFISGIRPNLSEKNVLGYELTKGPLYRVAKKASQELIDSAKEGREPHPYVLIIDEINRGNVAKIFGELITLIDEDKRSNPNVSSGIGIPLLYDEKGAKPFTLPSNLYIIGTMNSSDRSVQKLDSALRRRFYFDAVDPDPSLLKTEGSRLADFLAQLNLRLEAKRPNSGCQIGHAWFMRKGSPVKGDADLVEILNEKVFPLLQEWFWDDEKAIRAIFLNDSVSYLSSSGRLSFDGLKTDKLEAFFEEFIKQSPKK